MRLTVVHELPDWDWDGTLPEKVAYRAISVIEDLLSTRGVVLQSWEKDRIAECLIRYFDWGNREYKDFIRQIAVKSGVIEDKPPET